MRNTMKILFGKSEEKKQFGRRKLGWRTTDLKETEYRVLD
jgi:hypothetical protein